MVWVGKDRKTRKARRFFSAMGREQRERSEAVVRDMGDPYIVARWTKVPHVKVVFDLFHVVAQFSRVIDKVLNSEYQKASGANKAVFKGVGYLLPRNRTNLCRFKGRRHLEELLRLNKVINAVLILKDKLKPIWTYKSRTWAEKAIDEWCALAKAVNHPAVRKSVKTLEGYRYGILNHGDYPIHTGSQEGVNNKIKVIIRRAYGFHDLRYLSLGIIQGFTN